MNIVYIEDAILSSMIINYLLISLTLYMMHCKVHFYQKFLGGILATTVSILISLTNMSSIYLLFVKLILGAIISVICVPTFKLKHVFLFYITFFAFTFLMGGVVLATECLFSISISPLIAVLVIYIFSILIRSAIKRFYCVKRLSKFSYDIKIKYKDEFQIVRAYLDSGNLIRDSATSKPIVILDFETFSKCFNITLLDYLSHKIPPNLSSRYIDVKTVNSNGKMLVLDLDDIYLLDGRENVKLSALIGVSLSSHFVDGYHALISPLML